MATAAQVKAIAAQFGETWSTAKVNQIVTQISRGQRTLDSVRTDVATRLGLGNTGTPAATIPATAQGPVGSDGYTPIFMVSPNGTVTQVGPGEIDSLLQNGWKWPTAAQQTATSDAMRANNPGYYNPGLAAGGAAAEDDASKTTPRDYRSEARLLFPWIPAELLDVFVAAWAQYGDPNLAMAALRQDSRYDSFFPGNRRQDGTVRKTEAEYLSTMEGYDREMAAFGLNGADFQTQKVRAFTNDRSPNEVASDLSAVYVGIVTHGDAIRKYYADTIGATGLSDAALLGSAVTFHDAKVSPVEFQRKISIAQIGGTGAEHGFTIAQQEAARLASFGLDEAAARTLYTRAQKDLPTLGDLQARFNDPNDPLTVEDYTNAIVLNDPHELGIISRLFGQERSQFSKGGLLATDRAGGQTGLLAR